MNKSEWETFSNYFKGINKITSLLTNDAIKPQVTKNIAKTHTNLSRKLY